MHLSNRPYIYAVFADRVRLRLQSDTEAVRFRHDEDGRIRLTVAVGEETLEGRFAVRPLVPEGDAELLEVAVTVNNIHR